MSLPLTTALLLLMPLPAFAEVPANDDFAMATEISAVPFSDSLDTLDATADAADPDCLGIGTWHSVWYAWTPGMDLEVAVSTSGSEYDTIASVWTYDGVEFTEVGCNDDYGGLTSLVPFSAVEGETYYILISSYREEGGGLLEVALYEYVYVPFVVTVALDDARTHVPSGEGKAWGTLTCSEPGWYDVYGSFTQRAGRFTVGSSFYTYGECTEGEMEWVAPIWGESSLVGRVDYYVSIWGYSSATGESDYASAMGSTTVRGWSGR